MIYSVDPSADEPIMLINKHIGFDAEDGPGVDGSLFQEELFQLDTMGKKRIQVYINSPGGIVMDGYNIYNAILKSNTKVDTYCVGIAASIAAVIFQAGREKIMSDYGLLMYHDPYTEGGGKKKDAQLEAMTNSIATMIATRTKKPVDDILAIMGRTTWIPASEAFTSGFCDRIEVSTEHNKKRATGAKAMWKESNLILNSILKINETQPTMKKVANKLGLVEDASEESIVNAIDGIKNKSAQDLKNLQAAFDKAKKEKDDAEEKFKNLQSEYDKMKAALDVANKEKTDATAKAEEEAAKNMITGFAKQGRIKNEKAIIDGWVENCKTLGLDKVKAAIEALPINKNAVKIENVKTEENVGELGSVIAVSMNKLREKNGI